MKTTVLHHFLFLYLTVVLGCSTDVLFSDGVTQELASLGLDRLKSALMALGLKCGG